MHFQRAVPCSALHVLSIRGCCLLGRSGGPGPRWSLPGSPQVNRLMIFPWLMRPGRTTRRLFLIPELLSGGDGWSRLETLFGRWVWRGGTQFGRAFPSAAAFRPLISCRLSAWFHCTRGCLSACETPLAWHRYAQIDSVQGRCRPFYLHFICLLLSSLTLSTRRSRRPS